MTPLRLGAALLLAVTCALGGGRGDAAAATAAQAIASLNAQRAANGIPADLTENPSWSLACANHMRYIQMNGGTLTHDESSGAPGYTADGAWAGAHSVLTTGGWPATGVNPFEDAPIHLAQILAPQLQTTGYAGGCMVSIGGWTRVVTAPQAYTYPGDGTSGFYFEQEAHERPHVPGDFVGLPEGSRTGPHLMFFYIAPGSSWQSSGSISQASLIGPDGPVDVRSLDNNSPIGGALPPGGILVVADPLRPQSVYTAHLLFTPNDPTLAPVDRTWTFTTKPDPAPPGCRWSVRISRAPSRSQKVRVSWTACGPAVVNLKIFRGRSRRAATVSRDLTTYGTGTMNVSAGRKKLRIVATISREGRVMRRAVQRIVPKRP